MVAWLVAFGSSRPVFFPFFFLLVYARGSIPDVFPKNQNAMLRKREVQNHDVLLWCNA